MKKIRAVVEIQVTDESDLTEKDLVWALKRQGLKYVHFPSARGQTGRQCDVKEFTRVVEYLPGGPRDPGSRKTLGIRA